MRSFETAFVAVLLLAVAAGRPGAARAQIFDDNIYTMVLLDQFEYAPGPSEQSLSLGAVGWTGGDRNRLWLRAEGEQSTAGGLGGRGEVEVEALYGRLVSPFFDLVAGARLDTHWGAGGDVRGHLAMGLQGVMPYRVEVEPTVYVSQAGDVSAEVTAGYSFFVTQRLVLAPELEASVAVQEVPAWDVGTGVNDLGLGFRLRYEISRKFAPYVGYAQDWTFGQTADLRKAAGEEAQGAFVFGVRFWR